AREVAGRIEGRRSSRRARAIRALVAAPEGLPFEAVAKEARGAPAVETLIADGTLARAGDTVRLAITPEAAEREVRALSRGLVEQAAAALLERLAALEEAGEPSELPLRGLPAEVGR